VATRAAARWHGWPRLTDEQGAPGKAAPDKAVAERAHLSGGSIVRERRAAAHRQSKAAARSGGQEGHR
jgi:hypothetical protein